MILAGCSIDSPPSASSPPSAEESAGGGGRQTRTKPPLVAHLLDRHHPGGVAVGIAGGVHEILGRTRNGMEPAEPPFPGLHGGEAEHRVRQPDDSVSDIDLAVI